MGNLRLQQNLTLQKFMGCLFLLRYIFKRAMGFLGPETPDGFRPLRLLAY